MRKVILFVHTTLDGFMGKPNDTFDWVTWDKEADQDFTGDLMKTADTILTGRATYQSFESSWPQRVADPATPPELRDFARWMVQTPMVVFTNTLDAFEMTNARRAEQDVATEVAALKAAPGKDMVIFGGASTVQTLVADDLIDEYWLKVNPTAIGTGLPIFNGVTDKLGLRLDWSKPYDTGVVGLRYTAAK